VKVDGWKLASGVVPVYNVEIEQDHTYFVGEVGWGFSVWSHNAEECLREVVVDPRGPQRPATPNVPGLQTGPGTAANPPPSNPRIQSNGLNPNNPAAAPNNARPQYVPGAEARSRAPRSGSGRNEPHGRQPGTRLVERVQDLEAQLRELNRTQGSAKAKAKLRRKINNLNKEIDQIITGETHHMRGQ
jgi:hypothetical protein